MKSLTLCLVLVLSLLVHQGLSASVRGYNEDSADHLAVEESDLEEAHHRIRRYSHLSICRFCCNCCKREDCGLCCST